MEENSKGVAVWNNLLSAALKIPGVQVNRVKYLEKELHPFLPSEDIRKIIDAESIIPTDVRDRIVKSAIKFHLTTACSLSAVAGIPGGWAMLASVPVDLAQFYAQIIMLIQKMLYLYGWDDLADGNGEMPDETRSIITLWIGIAMGSVAAQNAMKNILQQFAKQAVKRIPRIAFGHSTVYIAVKTVGKWIGVEVTKKSTARTLSKIIPLIGAPIGAGMTYATFKPMAGRLKKYLDENPCINNCFRL